MTLIDRRAIAVFDWGTLLTLAAILAIGVMLVASASAHEDGDLARRQSVWMGIALGLAFVLGVINYRHLVDNAYLIWGVCIAALIAMLLFAPAIQGARSWIRIGGFGLQPSEFTKIAVILALARLFGDREPRPFGLRQMVMPLVLVAIPMALIGLQPDQGTAATLLPIVAAIAWASGLRVRTVGWVIGLGALVTPIWYATLMPYQRLRLTSFLNPEADPQGAGYQLVQSKIAVGSGGLIGKGLFSGTQSQLDFLPAQENDFIMALMGEELGFIGVACLLGLYLLLLIRILRGAYVARHRSGSYLCVGVASLLAFHLAVNVGMVVGLVPITGIPLPLLSYGGSSAMATAIGMGLVVSVRSRRFIA